MPNKVYITKEQAELIHSKETILAHHGVKGMRWGVRNEKEYSNNLIRKAQVHRQTLDRDWLDATKGMSKAKAFGIGMLLGPKWGARAINAAKKRNENPKRMVKQQTKKLRQAITNDFDKRSGNELKAHKKEFQAKYGKTKLSHFKNTPENLKRADAYSNTLTSRMEKMFNEVASQNLAGTSYGVRAVQGFNDFLPDFEIYYKNE